MSESGSVDDKGALSESEDESATVDDESAPVDDESAPVDDESAPVDDESAPVDDDKDPYADDLYVPSEFSYQCFGGMRDLKTLFGGPDADDVLVVRKEYELLYEVLEQNRSQKSIIVLGHPGIGSYGSWL